MTIAKGSQKPAKPRADFPLSAHGCGQWCKKIHGKIYYFGPWDDPDAAEAEFRRQEPWLRSGGDVSDPDAFTIKLLCDTFMSSRKAKMERGDLAQQTFNDYLSSCKRLANFFGRSRVANLLTPKDFERFRDSFPASWGSVRVNNEIARVSAVINHAYKQGDINSPIRTGVEFSRVTQKKINVERANNNAKYFTASEVHKLIDNASVQMRAMILLGVNAGYGNADCARLTRDMIDGEWLSKPRHKSGVWRAAWLWPETRVAIADVLAKKRTRVPEEYADLVFLTRLRNPWWVDGQSGDAITKEFTKIRRAAGVFRKNVAFYALRHITQTVGEKAPASDPLAIKIIMGHVDSSISAKYREHYDPQPIKRVCEHLRAWYLSADNA